MAAGLTGVRLWDVSRSFHLAGDQIRDWALALNGFRDLPLTGPPSVAGGLSFGPVYYWVLWLSRILIGPWCHDLPHAGAIGISLLQAAADMWLGIAIWRRWGSVTLAAATLALACGVLDVAFSSTIWNPPVALAFAKVSVALWLTGGWRDSRRAWIALVVSGWLAVQAHSGAVFAVAPLLLTGVWRRSGDTIRAVMVRGLTTAGVIGVLQLPWLWYAITHPETPVFPTTAVAQTLGQAVPGMAAAKHGLFVIGLIVEQLSRTWTSPPVVALVALLGIFGLWRQRSRSLAVVVVAPILLSAFAFARWQTHVEDYWFMSTVPGLALAAALGVYALPPLPRRVGALAGLVALVALLPLRQREAFGSYRLPGYRAIVRGTRAIYLERPEIYRIDLSFDMPPDTDPEFVYRIYGGVVNRHAHVAASIDAAGHVTYRRVNPE